jgi:hypothetical protein
MWLTEAAAREAALEETEDVDDDTLTAAMLIVKIAAKQEAAETEGVEFYEGTIPSNAYVGFSQTKSSNIYWYTKGTYELLESSDSYIEGSGSLDWSTGTMAYTATDGTKKQIEAINKASASTNSTSSGGSSSGSSSDSGAVILLAGGAVVVAGVGLYLYTHPAVVQQIKNFFTGNSAAKAAAESTEAAAESAGETAAESTEAAAESAGETAAENTVELPAEAAAAA